MPTNWSSGYTFPILNSSGASTGVNVDMSDMFVRKELFLDSGLWVWGNDSYGQLGIAPLTGIQGSPVQVGTLTDWKQVASGTFNMAGIQTNGTLWSWGLAAQGAIGNNQSSTNYSSPVQIGTNTNWKYVSCGYSYTLALKTNGTLWSWGWNNYGQLGLGAATSVNYSSPVQVGNATTWKQISAGTSTEVSVIQPSSGAVKTDGTLWMWGLGNSGQMGNNATSSYSSPIQVGALTTWQQVSCGYGHIGAIQTNGTLWTWGRNASGQLGNGNTTQYISPIQIGALTNWQYVSCGYNYTLAIQTNGTLWAWGNNNVGQLGNGTTTGYLSPIQIGALTNWKQVVASGTNRTSFALQTNNTAWVWGGNTNSAGLGIATSSPVQIGTNTTWRYITGGYSNGLGITSSDLPD